MAKSKTALDVRRSRELPSATSSHTITKDVTGRYFVSFLCEFEPVLLPIIAKAVGIDVGLSDFSSPTAHSNNAILAIPLNTRHAWCYSSVG